ncbi:hypothetical protein F1559_000653 [Cyanidiococcus yangmingshanensis]|uniref:Sugar phosphate transporter domain-containing protein n=1 Tax=Cyanidiococcus yangmingshanensis TaxID=2690220 RepID=A0A7J7IJJ5_9RHOD|nr:hypothetical protein F1559_000653 [Cyanidiococcus yangmingshanensis]
MEATGLGHLNSAGAELVCRGTDETVFRSTNSCEDGSALVSKKSASNHKSVFCTRLVSASKSFDQRWKAAQVFFIWTVISVLHLYVTRELLAQYFVSEVFLTLIQTMLSIIYGWVVVRLANGRSSIRLILRKKHLLRLLPLALVALFRDLCKFGGLARVSVNLTVTIRSLSPVASVLMQRAFWGDDFSLEVVLSLIPIMAGVSLASAADLVEASTVASEQRTDAAFITTVRTLMDDRSSSMSRFFIGCISCILSVFFGVGHSMLTKRMLIDEHDRFDPLSLQFAQSLLSLALLLPYFALRLLTVAWNLADSKLVPAPLAATSATDRSWRTHISIECVRNLRRSVRAFQLASLGLSSSQHRKNLIFLLATKGMVNFAQSLFSLISLHELNNVSFNIASSMRRMISGALTVVLFYRASISVYGILGIAVSIAGCLMYERASARYQQNAKGKFMKSERASYESVESKRDPATERHQASVALSVMSA